MSHGEIERDHLANIQMTEESRRERGDPDGETTQEDSSGQAPGPESESGTRE